MYIYVGYPDAYDRGLGIRVLSALRGLFVDARWTFSLASCATVPAYFDGTRGGPARRPARGLVRSASSQRYDKPSKRRRVRLSAPKDETPFISYPKAVRQKLLLAEVSNQSVFETRNYVCLKTLSSTRVTIKTDRFFDRRVGLPRLHRAGFARRPTR